MNKATEITHLLFQPIGHIKVFFYIPITLIYLDKKPGVCPIGIGDVPRRILAKAILYIIGNDIQLVTGALQTCAGQTAGAEAAIHAMRIYLRRKILRLSSSVMLIMSLTELIVKLLFTTLASFGTILQNTYGAPIRLFITGEGELSSTEGTTQGDPLAMAMYTLAVTPLIQAL